MIKNLFFISSVFLGTSLYAQDIIFSENFDNVASQQLWTINDQDGDQDTWEFMLAKDSGIPTFSGGFAWSWSWLVDPLFPDNTLTSPVMKLPESNSIQLKFKVAAASNDSYFQEHYAVYVIPENSKFEESSVAVFEETLTNGYYEQPKLVNVDLSEYAGQSVQLVFRHYDSSDLLYIGLDDVEVSAESTLAVKEDVRTKVTVYKDANQNVKIAGMKNVDYVRVFDLNGNVKIESKSSQVNIGHLPAGIYMVNFYNKEEVISRKIIK